MHEDCPHCGHHFEKEPGFFLGAMYVSYALTIAEGATMYFLAYYFVTRSAFILPIIFAVVIPLTFVNRNRTKNGEINVTYCQPSNVAAAIRATPVHNTISPK